jgi:hypothetical protein
LHLHVEDVGRTVVGLKNEVVDGRALALQHLAASIARAGVDDDVLDVIILLRKHAVHALAQVRRLVE